MKPLKSNVYSNLSFKRNLKLFKQTVQNPYYYYKSYFCKVNYHETIKKTMFTANNKKLTMKRNTNSYYKSYLASRSPDSRWIR
jgi:hypothetical protein